MKKKILKPKKANPLSSKNNTTLKELEQRKKRIETELNQIHHNLDNSFNNVKASLIRSIDPSDRIRKKPLKSLGIVVITGFAIGLMKGRRKRSVENGRVLHQKSGIANLMFDEVRRLAARKAALYFLDLVEANLPGFDKSESKKE